jgi:hypothetical protein
MRDTLMAMAVVALVVTAGCSFGPVTDTASPSTDAGTPGGTPGGATPAGTTTVDGTAGPGQAAAVPGVESGRLTNVSALLAAHRAALEREGYVGRTTTDATTRVSDLTVRVTTRRLVRAESGTDQALVERTRNRTTLVGDNTIERSSAEQVWSNGSVAIERVTDDDPRTPVYRPARDDGTTSVLPSVLLRVGVGNFVVTRTTETSNGTRVPLPAEIANGRAVDEQFTGTPTGLDSGAAVVVDGSGRIRSLSGRMNLSTVDGEGRDVNTEVASDYRLKAVGGVTVLRPDWVSTALRDLVVFDVSVSAVDGRYLAVTNEGPDPIPAGYAVAITQDGTGMFDTVGERVEPGETFYVYVPPDRTATVVVHERPTANARALSGTYVVRLVDENRDFADRETVTVEEDDGSN